MYFIYPDLVRWCSELKSISSRVASNLNTNLIIPRLVMINRTQDLVTDIDKVLIKYV